MFNSVAASGEILAELAMYSLGLNTAQYSGRRCVAYAVEKLAFR